MPPSSRSGQTFSINAASFRSAPGPTLWKAGRVAIPFYASGSGPVRESYGCRCILGRKVYNGNDFTDRLPPAARTGLTPYERMTMVMQKLPAAALALVLACLLFSSCAGRGGRQSSSAVSTETSSSESASSETVSGETTPETSSLPASSVPASSAAASTTPASSAQPRQTATVTIPYGYSLSQIGDALQAAGVCSKTDLLSAANSFDASAFSVASSIRTDHRTYRLEGYLYPDTYQFYQKSTATAVIQKMLGNAQSKIGSNYAYPGMSTDQLITLASIIQKEAKTAADMKKVSSVYHNRLNAGKRLQADPTIVYIESYAKPNLPDSEKDAYSSYYNTYKCQALPAGPICSPGANALNAAAHPDSTDYMYFVYDQTNSQTYYATTYADHLANCTKAGVKPSSQAN